MTPLKKIKGNPEILAYGRSSYFMVILVIRAIHTYLQIVNEHLR
jgi:hypothetical protein